MQHKISNYDNIKLQYFLFRSVPQVGGHKHILGRAPAPYGPPIATGEPLYLCNLILIAVTTCA